MSDANRLPDFLVIGAEKAGTTWLHTQLRSHEELFVPETKEIHFFNKWDSRLHLRDNYTEHDIDWYADIFKSAGPSQKIGEVTPLYLSDAKAPQRIAHTLPRAKFIAILRDPATRAYSHYWMAKRRGHETRSFEDVISEENPAIMGRGLYGTQLAHWLKSVDREALLVLIYEEVFAEPAAALQTIAKFLDIDAAGFGAADRTAVHKARRFRLPWLQDRAIRFARYIRERPALTPLANLLKRSGVYGAFRKMNEAEEDYPPMSDGDRQALDTFYADDISRLTEITGLDLTIWQKNPQSEGIEAD